MGIQWNLNTKGFFFQITVMDGFKKSFPLLPGAVSNVVFQKVNVAAAFFIQIHNEIVNGIFLITGNIIDARGIDISINYNNRNLFCHNGVGFQIIFIPGKRSNSENSVYLFRGKQVKGFFIVGAVTSGAA